MNKSTDSTLQQASQPAPKDQTIKKDAPAATTKRDAPASTTESAKTGQKLPAQGSETVKPVKSGS